MGKGGYQRETTLVLVVVICVFLFSQTPTFIDHILWTVVDKRQRGCGHWLYYYTAVSDTLAVLNASVNFIIYTVTSRKFRRGLILSCHAHDPGGGGGGGGDGPGRWGVTTGITGTGVELIIDRALTSMSRRTDLLPMRSELMLSVCGGGKRTVEMNSDVGRQGGSSENGYLFESSPRRYSNVTSTLDTKFVNQ